MKRSKIEFQIHDVKADDTIFLFFYQINCFHKQTTVKIILNKMPYKCHLCLVTNEVQKDETERE